MRQVLLSGLSLYIRGNRQDYSRHTVGWSLSGGHRLSWDTAGQHSRPTAVQAEYLGKHPREDDVYVSQERGAEICWTNRQARAFCVEKRQGEHGREASVLPRSGDLV